MTSGAPNNRYGWPGTLTTRQCERVAASFHVGLSRNWIGGGARLLIEQEALSAAPTTPTKAVAIRSDEIRHQRTDVVVAHRRLLPPFLSCAIPITDERGYVEAVVSFPIWSRSSIVDALRTHGFTVNEVSTWTALPNPPHRVHGDDRSRS